MPERRVSKATQLLATHGILVRIRRYLLMAKPENAQDAIISALELADSGIKMIEENRPHV